jgi:hypothetical protein
MDGRHRPECKINQGYVYCNCGFMAQQSAGQLVPRQGHEWVHKVRYSAPGWITTAPEPAPWTEIPMTCDMIAAGLAVSKVEPGYISAGDVVDIYCAMRAKETDRSPQWYHELAGRQATSISNIEAQRDAAIARAEAAERQNETWVRLIDVLTTQRDAAVGHAETADRQLAEMTTDRNLCREWWQIANKRLAERDASAKRWIKLCCVLALLLLPFGARAQQQMTYTPLQQTLLNQASQCEQVAGGLVTERDALRKQVAELQAKLDKAEPPGPPKP